MRCHHDSHLQRKLLLLQLKKEKPAAAKHIELDDPNPQGETHEVDANPSDSRPPHEAKENHPEATAVSLRALPIMQDLEPTGCH